MENPPDLAICLVTYKRTPEALRTIIGVCNNLEYPQSKRRWFINDDGSPVEHVRTILMMLEYYGETVGFVNTERFGDNNAGKGWNMTLGKAHEYSDYVLWLEDDWELRTKYYMEAQLSILHNYEDVGMVTFRGSGIDCLLKNIKLDGQHYLEFFDGPYIYSGNPHLRHARFTQFYGWFPENMNPSYLEWQYDGWIRQKKRQGGPKILRPAGIDEWGLFSHIGRERSF